jgi:hypothetical protein
MVELQNDRVGHAAVDAWVQPQVVEHVIAGEPLPPNRRLADLVAM